MTFQADPTAHRRYGRELKIPRPEDAPPWPFRRNHHTVRLRARIPSTKPALNRAVQDVLDLAHRCRCPVEYRADLEIALREALSNAIIHGNASQRDKRVFLRCYGAPGSDLFILVRDEGPGFDPEQVPDPRVGERLHLQHGRGLLLMRELMDYVEYRKNGREVMIYLSCANRAGKQ